MCCPRAREWQLHEIGPIGFDCDGHPVVLDRLSFIPPAELIAHFDAEAFLQQQLYNLECLGAFKRAAGLRYGKRLYKAVHIVDMAGLSMAHLRERSFMTYVQHVNECVGWNYPETVLKFVVINAPVVFTALWNMVKIVLHPVTVSKVHVSSGDPAKVLVDLGITLCDGGVTLPEKVPGWTAEMADLLSAYSLADLRDGFVPPEDLAALARIRAGKE